MARGVERGVENVLGRCGEGGEERDLERGVRKGVERGVERGVRRV